MPHRRTARSTAGTTHRQLSHLLYLLHRVIRHAWRAHIDLLATNAAYAAAITAAAAALASQTSAPDLLATGLAGALAVYASLRRGLAHL